MSFFLWSDLVLIRHSKSTQKACLLNYYISASYCLTFLLFLLTCRPSPPISFFFLPLFFFLNFFVPPPHLQHHTLRLCSLLLSLVLYGCGSIWAYDRWGRLAGTHRDISVWLLPGQQDRLCAYVCVCVLMCSVTLPLCLPATFCLNSPIPGGTATQTEADSHTHISSISQ